MSYKLQNRILTVFTVQLLMLALAVSPSFAMDFYLRAEQTTKTMPDGEIITMWGFAPDVNDSFTAEANATVPGPFLSVDTDDPNITIHLKNNLLVPVSIVIPGLVTSMDPQYFTDSSGRRRMRSLTHETEPNTVGIYTWNNLRDGSFIYESGTHQTVQVQMGLCGGLKIEADPNVPYTAVPVDYEVNLFFSEIDPALHEAVATGKYGSVDPFLVNENFNVGTGSFIYTDDAFRSTSEPNYANGNYAPTEGFTGGALKINLGGINSIPITGMSGSWTKNFNLLSNEIVTVSFRYKLTQSPNYEPIEFSEALVTIDGILYGSGGNDYQARIAGNGEGGPEITTGWQQVNINLGTLTAGTHTITIGVHNNKKTSDVETTNILIDDVVITRTVGVMMMTSTINYDPKYFLINGQPYSQAVLPLPAGGIGETTLLRFFNAGLQTTFPVLQGLYMDIIAEDGFTYQFPKSQYSVLLPAGKTKDALIVDPAVEGFYPIYDRSLNLTDATQPNGGMLAFLNVGNLNTPPAITSITATPAAIIDGMTSQLSVTAFDSERSPLSYNWSVPPGDGSLDNATITNPVYTAPGNIVGLKVVSIGVDVGDGTDTTASSVNVAVQGAFLSETFDSDAGSFNYLDNTFRDTTASAYESGSYDPAGGFTGGGLRVDLGEIDSTVVDGMSGGWSATFNLAADSTVNLSFRFNLTQSPNYEPVEFSQALVAVDGTLLGSGSNDYLANIAGDGEGGPEITTSWQQVNMNLGTLTAGNHTITIGAFNNRKTSVVESTELLIDDVLITP